MATTKIPGRQLKPESVTSNEIKDNSLTSADFTPASSATLKGNTFNGPDQLVVLDAHGKLPAIDGSQLTGIEVGGSGTVTGTGTLGKISKWSSSTAIADSIIFEDSGKIGIGTITPDSALHVVGSLKIVDGNEEAGKVLTSDADGIGSWQPPSGGGPWTTSGSNIYNSNSGNVGIGTNAPGKTLHVAGNTYITGNLGIGTLNPSNPLEINGIVRVTNGSFKAYNSIGYHAIYDSLGIGPDTARAFYIRTNNLARLYVDSSGNVGIGTSAPDTKLHVLGSVKMIDGNQAAGKVMTSDANGVGIWTKVRAPGLPTYANNAAALGGALSVGDLYRNGADPDQVCVVH